MLTRCATVACVLVLSASVHASVIVIDGPGVAGGLLLQAAIDSAHDGDILLLEPGDYTTVHPQPYLIQDKTLALVGDGSVVLPGIVVEDLAERRYVVLRGLTVQTSDTIGGPACQVAACEGVVWAEDCRFTGAFPGAGASASGAARLVLTRCVLRGADGEDGWPTGPLLFAAPGAAGLIAISSHVSLVDSRCEGGRGGVGLTKQDLPNGGEGVRLSASTATISGGALRGGDTGVDPPDFTSSGSGLLDGGALPESIHLRDVAIAAGEAFGNGLVAPAIAAPRDAVVSFPASPRSLALPAPLHEGQIASLKVEGLPGDVVWLLAASSPTFMNDAWHQGVAHVDPSRAVVALVTTISDSKGHLDLPFTVPELPASIAGGMIVVLQAVHLGVDGTTLGAPSTLVWLDAAL